MAIIAAKSRRRHRQSRLCLRLFALRIRAVCLQAVIQLFLCHCFPAPAPAPGPAFPAVFRNNFKFNLRLFIYSQANSSRESRYNFVSHIFSQTWVAGGAVVRLWFTVPHASHCRQPPSQPASRHSSSAPSDKRCPAAHSGSI